MATGHQKEPPGTLDYRRARAIVSASRAALIVVVVIAVAEWALPAYLQKYDIAAYEQYRQRYQEYGHLFGGWVGAGMSDIAAWLWHAMEGHHHAILSAFTVVLALGTMGLAGYTAMLWRATVDLGIEAQATSKRQEREMSQSLDIARDAANASRQSAVALVDANIPYIAPELQETNWLFAFQGREPFQLKIHFVFRNYGNSPATVIEFRDYLCVAVDLPREPVYPPHPIVEDREIVIAKGGDTRKLPCGLVAGIGQWQGITMTPTEILQARDFIWVGSVIYDDVFGWRHTKRYCRILTFTPNGASASRPHGGREYNRRTREQSPYA